MHEVFLSHASRDIAKARRLRKVLLEHDVPVWFSPHNLRGAQNWQKEIGAALARCDWFIVLLTPNAVKSVWVQREVEYVLDEDRYHTHIVPLLFKECDQRSLSWVLPQLQSIDFSVDFWVGCKELLRLWDKPLTRPARKKRRK